MRERLRLDVYNVIIIALIPFVLLVAWGLTWRYDRHLQARQCEDAITYLQEVAAIAPEFTSAATLDDADAWLADMQDMTVPAPATDLHNGAVAAYSYAARADLPADPALPGSLYDELTTFKGVLDRGRETLVDQCPAAAPLIVDAFPMYFRKDGA